MGSYFTQLFEHSRFLATKNNNQEIVKMLLSAFNERKNQQENVNISLEDALDLSVEQQNIEIVRLLLECGVNLNVTDVEEDIEIGEDSTRWRHTTFIDSKDSVLMVAITKCNLEIVELLLSAEADVNYKNSMGQSPLMLAIEGGEKEMVGLLLKHEALVVDLRDELSNKSALMLASENGEKKMVEMLLDREADVNLIDNLGNSALMLAIDSNHKEIVELLLRRDAGVNLENVSMESPLMMAVKKGNVEIVELLINKGANFRGVNTNGENVLMLAVKNNKQEIAELLLNKIQHIPNTEDAVRTFKDSALVVAFEQRNENMMELLMNQGADPRGFNKNGKNALMVAFEEADPFRVMQILNRDAHMNVVDNNGETALMLAVKSNNRHFVEFLLNKGVDVNMKNENQESALSLAVQKGEINYEIIQILCDKGADVDARIIDLAPVNLKEGLEKYQNKGSVLGKRGDDNPDRDGVKKAKSDKPPVVGDDGEVQGHLKRIKVQRGERFRGRSK